MVIFQAQHKFNLLNDYCLNDDAWSDRFTIAMFYIYYFPHNDFWNLTYGRRCDCHDVDYDIEYTQKYEYSSREYDFGFPYAKRFQDCSEVMNGYFHDNSFRKHTHVYGDIKFDSESDFYRYMDLHGQIEAMYDCSGIWQVNNIYAFSDITKGTPKDAWWTYIRDDLLMEKMMTHGVILLLLAIVV